MLWLFKRLKSLFNFDLPRELSMARFPKDKPEASVVSHFARNLPCCPLRLTWTAFLETCETQSYKRYWYWYMRSLWDSLLLELISITLQLATTLRFHLHSLRKVRRHQIPPTLYYLATNQRGGEEIKVDKRKEVDKRTDGGIHNKRNIIRYILSKGKIRVSPIGRVGSLSWRRR